MPYVEIAMCLIGMSFYFNAGKFEARDGGADHALLWAALSLLTTLAVLYLGGRWLPWLLAQLLLLLVIAALRVWLEERGR